MLVVNKPAGLNTHAPSPYAGEGLYDWLRHRKPRWSNLAIIHRLDKETSGVIVFSKSAIANRALTEQFASHTIRKTYLFLTDRAASRSELSIRSALVRAGEKYLSRPVHVGGTTAETRLRLLQRGLPATGPRAVPGSQHVRPHRQRGISLDGLGGGWLLRAGDPPLLKSSFGGASGSRSVVLGQLSYVAVARHCAPRRESQDAHRPN